MPLIDHQPGHLGPPADPDLYAVVHHGHDGRPSRTVAMDSAEAAAALGVERPLTAPRCHHDRSGRRGRPTRRARNAP